MDLPDHILEVRHLETCAACRACGETLCLLAICSADKQVYTQHQRHGPHLILLRRFVPGLCRHQRKQEGHPSMRLRQQQQRSGNVNALAELGLFSAGIMHEIKNALQGIANALFLLAGERSLSPKVREEVEIASRELSRAFDVCAQTLALAREENPVAMSVVDVLEEVLSAYSAKTAYKHLTVERQYEFSGEIQGSPGAIRQVFSNIVLNALESAPFENGKLVIHTYACHRAKNRKTPGVQIDFADNGPGIPDQYKKRVFEPLFSTKKGKGSGLGLWVAHRLVLKQRGQISLVGEREGMTSGACFSVFLPLSPN